MYFSFSTQDQTYLYCLSINKLNKASKSLSVVTSSSNCKKFHDVILFCIPKGIKLIDFQSPQNIGNKYVEDFLKNVEAFFNILIPKPLLPNFFKKS